MSYVNEKQVLRVYEQINPALNIEGEPLFLEGFEELAILITSKSMGQRVGAAEAASSDAIVQFQGITIDESGGENGDGTPVIVNTPTPEEQQEPESSDHEGEGGAGELMDENEGKGSGADEEGEDGEATDEKKKGKGSGAGQGEEESENEGGKDSKSEGGKKGEGKGKSDKSGKDKGDSSEENGDEKGSKDKGKGKGKSSAGDGEDSEGEKDSESEGEDGQDSDEKKGKGKSDKKGEQKEGEQGKPEQGDGQGQQQEGEEEQQQAEAMSEEELLDYKFKFQNLTKAFFGKPFSQNTYAESPAEFSANALLMYTGISMAMYDTIVRKYQDYPEREIQIRKAKAVSIIGMLESLASDACLKLSDDEGSPVAEEREALLAMPLGIGKQIFIQFVAADKICDKLLPLFLIFKKELFNRDKVLSYVQFCIEFMQQENKFLIIKDWANSKLETSNFTFVNRKVISNLEQTALAFKNSFNTKLREKKFVTVPLYRISDGKLSTVTENAEIIQELQMFVKSLTAFYFADVENKLKGNVRYDYANLMSYAEIRITELMKLELDDLSSFN